MIQDLAKENEAQISYDQGDIAADSWPHTTIVNELIKAGCTSGTRNWGGAIQGAAGQITSRPGSDYYLGTVSMLF